jgi:glucokinase
MGEKISGFRPTPWALFRRNGEYLRPNCLDRGRGVLETSPEFQRWFLAEIRLGMSNQREEQANIPIHVMPNGDTAGARGAALEALKLARQSGLA